MPHQKRTAGALATSAPVKVQLGLCGLGPQHSSEGSVHGGTLRGGLTVIVIHDKMETPIVHWGTEDYRFFSGTLHVTMSLKSISVTQHCKSLHFN